jgi:hypothetical protein
MALTILIRTQLNSIPVLSPACYTKQNFPSSLANATLSVNTPRGVLGGSVAGMDAAGPEGGDYVAIPCTEATTPIGLFVNDAAGAAFENAPAVASGKVAVMKGMGSVEVDVYETNQKLAPGALIVYNVGQYLYSSVNGLLTPEHSVALIPVGVVTKVPTTASPTLGLDMRI